MFTENKITEIQHKISALADRPQMSAQALKAYFDGAAEEIRVKFNALIDALDAFEGTSFASVDYSAADGRLTFTFGDGSTKVIDLPLELLIKSGHYDAEKESIVLALANGDVLNIPVSDLIDEYKADEKTLTCKENTFAVKDGVFTKEAPADGTLYARKNGVWENVSASLTEYAKTPYVQQQVANLKADRKLKLLKTITLEEDVASLTVNFDKPVDEIALLFNVAFLKAETKAMAASTDSGVWYMFWYSGAMKTEKQYFFAHAKEFAEWNWECVMSGGFFGGLQGISTSTTTPKHILSSRKRTSGLSRFLEKLSIFIPNNTTENAFAAGSTIEIWGHEADEDL